ncbi:hypothetical protein AVEN_160105-1 [Araneus ventricosus]|uniref:Uncharacterized protein n=1 Tax=Araneus ventricosus TaxID=182803 RepID=A0A4Y2GFL1_ARAVE|nr:hypothetical protein AVEN_160105-1 [Araneus ventricosus]
MEWGFLPGTLRPRNRDLITNPPPPALHLHNRKKTFFSVLAYFFHRGFPFEPLLMMMVAMNDELGIFDYKGLHPRSLFIKNLILGTEEKYSPKYHDLITPNFEDLLKPLFAKDTLKFKIEIHAQPQKETPTAWLKSETRKEGVIESLEIETKLSNFPEREKSRIPGKHSLH